MLHPLLYYTCLLLVMILSLMVLNLLSSAPSLSSWMAIIRSMFSIWALHLQWMSAALIIQEKPFYLLRIRLPLRSYLPSTFVGGKI